jgi:S-DNA-T family DNA segregation ATPase FtsK/SpoIIIE
MSKAKPPSTERTPQRRRAPVASTLRPEHRIELTALSLLAVAGVTSIFYLTGSAGTVGSSWKLWMEYFFGWGALVLPLFMGVVGVLMFIRGQNNPNHSRGWQLTGMSIFILCILLFLEFFVVPGDTRQGIGGGVVGHFIMVLLSTGIGRPASAALTALGLLIGGMLAFDFTVVQLFATVSQAAGAIYTRIRGVQTSALPATTGRRAEVPIRRTTVEPKAVPPVNYDDELAAILERPIDTAVPARNTASQKKAVLPAPGAGDGTARELPKNDLTAPTPTVAVLRPPVPINTRTSIPGTPVQASFDIPENGSSYRAWALPSPDLLRYSVEAEVHDDEHRNKSRLIEDTLASFKVEARVVNINVGPAVTQYELQPAIGVKVNKITTLDKDLALALAAPSIRIEAPIPGKSVVGIEIPNSSISTVALRDIVESDEFVRSKAKLRLPLGKDVSGMPVVAGMERMPHLLVAGSTGSGKSVAINCFICALLMRHTPDDLKFIMVDPKRVELVGYNGIPHLLAPVVTEVERVVPTLKWAVREMERRYKLFAKNGVRNLDSYRALARERTDLETMPYIVIIIDELADLMMMAPDDVETLICRLAQMARATGIHLIIATQRPSVDVVTGLIKANFPSRMAFAVTSQIDSRVILDQPGAEQLLGRGDMLFTPADSPRTLRVQGTYLTDDEVEQIVRFWRAAKPPLDDQDDQTSTANPAEGSATTPAFMPTPVADDLQPELARVERLAVSPREPVPHAQEEDIEPVDSDDVVTPMQPIAEFLSENEQDGLLPEAIRLVQQHKRASASLLQRRLRIGYSKASQLIDLLEEQGIVGPAEEGRSREVLTVPASGPRNPLGDA